MYYTFFFFFSSRRRHTSSYGDWSSDVCSSDLRCCRAFAHTVDQGGSEQVGAVGNWIGGGPAQRLVVLVPYAQILLFQPFLAIVCCCTSRLVPSTQFTQGGFQDYEGLGIKRSTADSKHVPSL